MTKVSIMQLFNIFQYTNISYLNTGALDFHLSQPTQKPPTHGTCCTVKHHLNKPMVPHSNTLAWKITWTEEPGGLQPMGSLRVGHD